MIFVDLEPGDRRLETDVLPVLQELRPHLTPASFAAIYAEGYPQGLRFTGLFAEDLCVAVAGWRVVATTVASRKLYVDDLVTAEAVRSRGFGKALLAELRRRAEVAGCSLLDLDSALHRADAHRFYEREGMSIVAHHFGQQVPSDRAARA